MPRLAPLVDCVRRGEAFARGGLPAVTQLQGLREADAVNYGWRYAALNPEIAFDRATAPFSDASSSWQRPWTIGDTVFVGVFAALFGVTVLTVWNPQRRRSR